MSFSQQSRSPHAHAAGERKPARVLFAIPSMGLGGSERVLFTLLLHLDRSHFEPHLALLESDSALFNNLPKEHDVLLKGLPEDVTVHVLGVTRARYAVIPIVRLCWKLRPRAVLSMSAHLNSAILSARPLLPKGISLLAREGTTVTSREVTTNRFRFACYKYLYRLADVVICQSDSMKEQFVREFGITPKKTTRIYNPVDIDLIRTQAELGPNPFPNAGPNLVAVGRLFPEKDHDLLLKCMLAIHAAFHAATLTIVGTGPLEATLKAQQKKLGLDGCVHFAGFQSNPYPFLKHADLLVLSSRHEALPNVVLEALALGKFVVATNCSGALSEIANTTSQIKIAAERTPECISAEVIKVLSRTRTNTPPQGPGVAFAECFGHASVISAYETLLRDCVDHRLTKALTVQEVLAPTKD
jgi:glycosyltransferase involved in cell wall biosynthesis